MKFSGWGRYPVIYGLSVRDYSDNYCVLPVGNFRSYGDAALSTHSLSMLANNRLISFNEKTGLLTCEAGVLFADIIETFLPRGWFLTVTPGTKLLTVGGALAADVHGKNHHVTGCFSACVESFLLRLPDSELTCSRTENVELFYATCGGMGLTGIITTVSFYLTRVKSQWIKQTTIKTTHLKDTFLAFEENTHATYSVAWIDCLAKGSALGRSLLMLGEFSNDGDFAYQSKSGLVIPFDFPNVTLNHWSVKAFNTLYYAKFCKDVSHTTVDVDTFFYPLDAIQQWNRIYGSNGFIQFQFILPKETSFTGLTEILSKISEKGVGSFLAVLKLYGPENNNWLSFPVEGYSLALDFKMQDGLIEFIHNLTDRVIALGGRVYLAKDALLTEQQFNKSYPNADRFRQLRQALGLNSSLQSLLSKRLNL